jgi:hypothetical protein
MSGHKKWRDIKHKRDERRRQGWTVTLDAAGEPDLDLKDCIVELTELLAPYGGAVSGRTDNSRYGATFSVDKPELDAASAVSFGCELFCELAVEAGLPAFRIVRAEVTTYAEHDAELAS